MGEGDYRNHREAEVEKRPGIVSDRSGTGGEFHYAADKRIVDGELVVRGQLIVDRLVLDRAAPLLPEGTRRLPVSDIGDRLAATRGMGEWRRKRG